MVHKNFKLTSLALASSLLVACGGGGGGGGGGDSSPSEKSLSGIAVDFYLKGATVKLDNCNNYTITNATNENGQFNFTLPSGCTNSAITITDGTDVVTGKNFSGTLKIENREFGDQQLIASPLTTLQAILNNQKEFEKVLESLGFTADEVNIDPVKLPNPQKIATLFIVQQILTQIEDNLESLGLDPETALKFAANTLATQLTLIPLTTNGAFNTKALETVLAGVSEVIKNDQTILKDISASKREELTAQVETASANITSLANAVTAAISSGSNITSGSALAEALKKDEKFKEITDKIFTAPTESVPAQNSDFALSELSFLGSAVRDLKLSTAKTPILINKSQILTLDVLKLKATPSIQSQADRVETMKIGIQIASKLQAAQNPELRDFYVNLYIDKVEAIFDSTGTLKKIKVPRNPIIVIGTDVNVTKENLSKLPADLLKKYPVANSLLEILPSVPLTNLQIPLAGNYTLEVQDGKFPVMSIFTFQDERLPTGFDNLTVQAYQYALREIQIGDSVDVTVTIRPTNASFGALTNSDWKNKTIISGNSNTTFNGYSITGHFKTAN